MEVTVGARPGSTGGDGLAFRLYTDGRALPVALGRLRRSGALFTGSAPLLGGARPPFTVDVHDTGLARPPRLGCDRVTAAGLRWTARAVSAPRLAAPGADADRTARRALQQAALTYQLLIDTEPADRRAELARRRRARCFALLRAVLLRSGTRDEAEHLAERWGIPADPVRPADVAPPDLTAPGWLPLLVEHALITPQP